MLRKVDAWWRAANYLSVGPDLPVRQSAAKRPLALDDVKRMLLGHWGTTPGQNFIYAHLNRVIVKYDLDMIFISGPGSRRAGGGRQHLSRRHATARSIRTSARTKRDCGNCSCSSRFPAAFPATCRRNVPGSIHEGGELGYSLSHAFGAAFDNPDLIVACVVGDGEAETGPLATAWHSNKFLDPRDRRRGAADPASERLQDRQSHLVSPHPARRARAAAARLRLDAAIS